MSLVLAALLAAAVPAAAVPVTDQIRIEGRAVQGGIVRGRVPAGTISLQLDGTAVPLASDGRFILGFDRDRGPEARVSARLADGSTVERTVAVEPRGWAIEHVNVTRRPAGLTGEAYRRRREAELARIHAARSARSPSAGWSQTFLWPASGRISGRFGSQRVYRGVPAAYHSGVDVAAGAGAPVVAPADGVVVLAAPPAFSLEGNLVIVDHGMGLNSAFLHLASIEVDEGQRVSRGQRIGTVGATGRATGPHLHWSLSWNGSRLDPERVAGAMGRAAP